MNEESLMQELWKYKKMIEALDKRLQYLENKVMILETQAARGKVELTFETNGIGTGGHGFVPLSNNPEAHDYAFYQRDGNEQKG